MKILYNTNFPSLEIDVRVLPLFYIHCKNLKVLGKSKLTHTFGKSKHSLPSILFTLAVKVEKVMVHSEISFIV